MDRLLLSVSWPRFLKILVEFRALESTMGDEYEEISEEDKEETYEEEEEEEEEEWMGREEEEMLVNLESL